MPSFVFVTSFILECIVARRSSGLSTDKQQPKLFKPKKEFQAHNRVTSTNKDIYYRRHLRNHTYKTYEWQTFSRLSFITAPACLLQRFLGLPWYLLPFSLEFLTIFASLPPNFRFLPLNCLRISGLRIRSPLPLHLIIFLNVWKRQLFLKSAQWLQCQVLFLPHTLLLVAEIINSGFLMHFLQICCAIWHLNMQEFCSLINLMMNHLPCQNSVTDYV